MRKERLRELLGRFYEGLATPEEEEEMLTVLSSDDTDEEFRADRDLVLYLCSMSQERKPDEGFETRILKGIARHKRQKSATVRRRYFITLLSAAAALILAIVVWSVNETGKREVQDTYSDVELAYAETLRVLLKVSSDMNRGKSALSPLQAIETAESSIGIINETGSVLGKRFLEMEKLLDSPQSDEW